MIPDEHALLIPDAYALPALDACDLVDAVRRGHHACADRILDRYPEPVHLLHLLQVMTVVAANLVELTAEGSAVLEQLRNEALTGEAA